MDRVGTGFGDELRGSLGVFGLDAARCSEFSAIDSRPDWEVVTGPIFRSADHLSEQSSAVLPASAIFIFAMIPGGRKKLGKEVSMRSVDLDGIEAGLPRTDRRRGESFDDPGDVFFFGFFELGFRTADRLQEPAYFFAGEVIRHIHCTLESGLRRNQKGTSLFHVHARDLAVVDQLKGDLCAVAMDSVSELLEAREKVVARDRELSARGGALGIGDRTNLGHDQPDPASRPFLVVGDDRLSGMTVFAREFDTHRRHGHAIAQLHRANPDR